MERLRALPPEKVNERELSVLENLLLKNENPKIAVTMAIDMMAGGIDTVRTTSNNRRFTSFPALVFHLKSLCQAGR